MTTVVVANPDSVARLAEEARVLADYGECITALRELRVVARVLWQSAERCAAIHHGSDDEPGWLRDCDLAIQKADAILAKIDAA